MFLSFDDGFREMSDVVAPLCRQMGVPATFFLTTGFLDNRTLGYRHKASLLIDECRRRGAALTEALSAKLIATLAPTDAPSTGLRELLLSTGYHRRHLLDQCAALLEVDFDSYLRTEQPYLTQAQVKNLLREGFSIGGHSIDHPKYADLRLEDQLNQTRGCMEYLHQHFQLAVKAFAFPFVSDGVAEPFYEEMFGGQMADLAFCIGQMPKAYPHRAVQRFGVESDRVYSLPDLLSRQVEGRFRQSLANWKKRIAFSS